MARRRAFLCLLSLAAVASVAPASLASAAPTAGTAQVNPFAGARLYLDAESDAARQERAWQRTRPADAALLAKIASHSQADWYDYADGVQGDVSERVRQVTGAGALPVLVAYFIPHRDCGSFSAGGAATAHAYRAWIHGFAAGISDRSAAVILEPDALAGTNCLSRGQQASRLRLLRYAVDVLAAHPRIAVYIDAGNAAWQPAAGMARRLLDAGVAHARGFALNVSNFISTARETVYGKRIVALLHRDAHFVIDTSRNGRGPAPRDAWCNPPGRGLGTPPVAATQDPSVDAYLWIKTPGESDGTCAGGPPAGDWWASYALGLAARAAF